MFHFPAKARNHHVIFWARMVLHHFSHGGIGTPHVASMYLPEGEVVELFAIAAYGRQLRNTTNAIGGCRGRFCISMGFQAGEFQREHHGNFAVSWLLKDCREKKFGI